MILNKVNEGDEKNKPKKHSWKNIFLSAEMYLFFPECVFYLPKLRVFFGNRQQSNARAGQKKTHVFLVMRGLNLMRALI